MMTQLTGIDRPPHSGAVPPPPPPGSGGQLLTQPAPLEDRPARRRAVTASTAWELGGSAVSALAFVWLVFSVAGESAPFGMFVAWFFTFVTLYAVVCWRLHGVMTMKDRLATLGMWSGASIGIISLVAVMAYVVKQGGPVVWARFPHFFYADMSQAGPTNPVTAVGAGAAIVGTVEQIGLASIMTVPLGIMTGIFLVDAPGPFARAVSAVVDAMTGAPAIIAGIFIYILWVEPRHTSGKSGFAASMALAVMMLPIVTRAAKEVIAVVPGSLREAALALGAPRWRVVLRVVLPTARAGLMTATILGIARVAGETAPILFDAGGNDRFNWNPFSGQQDNLPLRIYELIYQGQLNLTRDAWGVSFVLVLVVLTLFVSARLAGRSRPGRRTIPWARFRPTTEVHR
jgi:phosphate transport system permease protein